MLKSLELFGFKSFADRTRFEFPPGVTGIVGPNGSGKSNVVDAIKWILGDQSAKSLRGKEMVDVVFNGASGRKPSNLAEATLTFDNSGGFLPIDLQEVQIGRRIWRSGDSEYLINGAPARLKDIRELFMGTGAGSSAYCIIEQGRVDQILQANAINRRHFFEEAAGISRYKARKGEALRKFERVEQNLLRLTDIVDEVEAQLNSLRSQADKAAKYHEVSQQLRELWLGLAADEFRNFSKQLEQLDRSIADWQSQREELERRLHKQQEQLSALDVEISEVDDRLRQVERRRSSNREAAARHEATIRHESARLHELDSELARLLNQRAVMRARVQESDGELERTQRQLAGCEAEFTQTRVELDARKTQIKNLDEAVAADRRQIKQWRERLFDATRDLTAGENRIAALQSQLDDRHAALRELTGRREELARQIDACRSECNTLRDRVRQAEQDVAAADERIASIQKREESLAGTLSESQQSLARNREQRSALQARMTVLEDLEQRQQGLGIGVKEILRRAKNSHQPPWNRIHGTVADLLQVDLEQAALLDVALANRSQLIVIDEFEPLIEYLKRANAPISGRVGFLEFPVRADEAGGGQIDRDVEAGTGEEPAAGGADFQISERDVFRLDGSALPDLSGAEGVRERADRRVESPAGFRELAQRLLADTWIVETIEVARRLSSDDGRGCRFVTLQGELLDSDGTITVGTVRSESAVVSRKSELRRLKSEIAALDKTIANDKQRLSSLDESLGEIDSELVAADAERQNKVEQHAALASELAGREQHLERLLDEQDATREQAAQLDERRAEAEGDLEQAVGELEQTQQTLDGLRVQLEEAERSVATSQQRLENLQQTDAEQQTQAAKQQERLNSLRGVFERLERDRKQRRQQRDEAERRYAYVASKRAQCVLQILNTNAMVAELALVDERVGEEAAALSALKVQLRAQRAGHLDEEAGMRRQRRELDEAQHRDEMNARDLRHQISTLEGRIDEEYQVALADVVASGASALESYCRPDSNDGGDRTRKSAAADGRGSVEGSGAVGDNRPTSSLSIFRGEPAGEATEWQQPEFDEVREQLAARVDRLRKKLKLMGNVSTDSLRDLDELDNRYRSLKTQLDDLVEAKQALDEIIRRINTESIRLFKKTFETVRGHFQELFRTMFGGGSGDIVLEDPEDVLECGVDIVARPPGKEMKSISLMSGGEKTLTALALLLAIFKSRPSPYCLLDEVDAALDESNVERLLTLLQDYKQNTQFVLITHKKPTMTVADVLYGVTMEESGVSKRISVRLEEMRENGEFAAHAQQTPTAADGQQQQNRDAA